MNYLSIHRFTEDSLEDEMKKKSKNPLSYILTV